MFCFQMWYSNALFGYCSSIYLKGIFLKNLVKLIWRVAKFPGSSSWMAQAQFTIVTYIYCSDNKKKLTLCVVKKWIRTAEADTQKIGWEREICAEGLEQEQPASRSF